jgi:hypothetical protein
MVNLGLLQGKRHACPSLHLNVTAKEDGLRTSDERKLRQKKVSTIASLHIYYKNAKRSTQFKGKIPHQERHYYECHPYSIWQTLINSSDLIHRQLLSRRIPSPIQLLREDERKK